LGDLKWKYQYIYFPLLGHNGTVLISGFAGGNRDDSSPKCKALVLCFNKALEVPVEPSGHLKIFGLRPLDTISVPGWIRATQCSRRAKRIRVFLNLEELQGSSCSQCDNALLVHERRPAKGEKNDKWSNAKRHGQKSKANNSASLLLFFLCENQVSIPVVWIFRIIILDPHARNPPIRRARILHPSLSPTTRVCTKWQPSSFCLRRCSFGCPCW